MLNLVLLIVSSIIFILNLFYLIRKPEKYRNIFLVISVIFILPVLYFVVKKIDVPLFLSILNIVFSIIAPLVIFILHICGVEIDEYFLMFDKNLYLMMGKNRKAKDRLNSYIKNNPKSYIAHREIAQLYEKEGGVRKAIEEYVKSIEINRKDYKSLYSITKLLEYLDKKDEAIELLKHLLEIKDDYIEAYILLGDLLVEKGKRKEAIYMYENAFLHNPNSFVIAYNLASEYVFLNSFIKAENILRKAIEIEEDFYAKYNLAQILFIEKNYQESKELFEETLVFPLLEDISNFELARISILEGRKEKAIEYLNEALNINPDLIHRLNEEEIFDEISEEIEVPIEGNRNFNGDIPVRNLKLISTLENVSALVNLLNINSKKEKTKNLVDKVIKSNLNIDMETFEKIKNGQENIEIEEDEKSKYENMEEVLSWYNNTEIAKRLNKFKENIELSKDKENSDSDLSIKKNVKQSKAKVKEKEEENKKSEKSQKNKKTKKTLENKKEPNLGSIMQQNESIEKEVKKVEDIKSKKVNIDNNKIEVEKLQKKARKTKEKNFVTLQKEQEEVLKENPVKLREKKKLEKKKEKDRNLYLKYVNDNILKKGISKNTLEEDKKEVSGKEIKNDSLKLKEVQESLKETKFSEKIQSPELTFKYVISGNKKINLDISDSFKQKIIEESLKENRLKYEPDEYRLEILKKLEESKRNIELLKNEDEIQKEKDYSYIGLDNNTEENKEKKESVLDKIKKKNKLKKKEESVREEINEITLSEDVSQNIHEKMKNLEMKITKSAREKLLNLDEENDQKLINDLKQETEKSEFLDKEIKIENSQEEVQTVDSSQQEENMMKTLQNYKDIEDAKKEVAKMLDRINKEKEAARRNILEKRVEKEDTISFERNRRTGRESAENQKEIEKQIAPEMQELYRSVEEGEKEINLNESVHEISRRYIEKEKLKEEYENFENQKLNETPAERFRRISLENSERLLKEKRAAQTETEKEEQKEEFKEQFNKDIKEIFEYRSDKNRLGEKRTSLGYGKLLARNMLKEENHLDKDDEDELTNNNEENKKTNKLNKDLVDKQTAMLFENLRRAKRK